MKRAGKIAASAAALMMVAGSAFAADVPQVVAPVAAPPPVATPTFDWGGIYYGGFAGWGVAGPFEFGGQVGYNFALGGAVVGIEGILGFYPAGPVFTAAVLARAGLPIGERLFVYALAGVKTYVAPAPPFYWVAGGGAAFAVGDSLSLFAEAIAWGPFWDCCAVGFRAGVNFHPGN